MMKCRTFTDYLMYLVLCLGGVMAWVGPLILILAFVLWIIHFVSDGGGSAAGLWWITGGGLLTCIGGWIAIYGAIVHFSMDLDDEDEEE